MFSGLAMKVGGIIVAVALLYIGVLHFQLANARTEIAQIGQENVGLRAGVNELKTVNDEMRMRTERLISLRDEGEKRAADLRKRAARAENSLAAARRELHEVQSAVPDGCPPYDPRIDAHIDLYDELFPRLDAIPTGRGNEDRSGGSPPPG